MKREITFLVLVLLLSVSLVSAQNDLTKKVGDLKELDIKNSARNSLNKSVEIPENLKLPAKIIFGIDEDMPFSKFVVYLMFWLFIFLIIFQIVKIMPFFKEGAIKFIAALAISVLASSLGSIRIVVELYYDLSLSKLIDATSPGAFIFTIILIIVVYFVTSKLLNKFENDMELGKLESS